MTTAEFWDQQKFSYLVTYSFNRGPKLAALHEASKILFRKIRQELLSAPSAQLPEMRNQLRRLERDNDLGMLTLTQGFDAFHITASPITSIEKYSSVAEELAGIMHVPVKEQFDWMCAPVYRDALAFYDVQNELISVLNICFGCDKMLTNAGEEVQADVTAYKALRQLLTQLGHPIETAGEQE